VTRSLIGEMFGAVQAVKVATAEDHVMAHFRTLTRTATGIAQDSLAHRTLNAVFWSSVSWTGSFSCWPQAIRAGPFNVGDFAPLSSTSAWSTEAMTTVGNFRRPLPPGRRLPAAPGGPPPGRIGDPALTDAHPLYSPGRCPPLAFVEKVPTDRLETWWARAHLS